MSVTRISGHTRSRPNQARQAAVAGDRRPPSVLLAPACAGTSGGGRCGDSRCRGRRADDASGRESTRSPAGKGGGYEDIEMLSDNDGLDLRREFRRQRSRVGRGRTVTRLKRGAAG